MWNPELGVTLCFLLQARWVISGHSHTENRNTQIQGGLGPQSPLLPTPSAPEEDVADQYCMSCGQHFDFSLEQTLSLLGHINPVSHFWLPALVR